MTTDPTAKTEEEARERIWLLRNEDGSLDDCWQMSTLSNTQDVEYVRGDILSTRDREIREVLEGLATHQVRSRRPCWCPSDYESEPHTPACLAARALWDRVQLTKENQ